MICGTPGEPPAPDPKVLADFNLTGARVAPLGSGLINRTWEVTDDKGGRCVLQAVNPIFSPAIHNDIEALTRHLERKGLPTPLLIPSRDGRLWVERGGRAWRLLTYVEGVIHDAVDDPRTASEAGRVLARFHRATADFDHELATTRLGVHDTAKHLRNLRSALQIHRDHREHAAVEALAEQVFSQAEALPVLPTAPDRIVHGDPKISNIVFDRHSGEGICLIDLDTVARMPIALELGDAFRSWCNPNREDSPNAQFSLPLFEAAVAGYASAAGGWLERHEWEAIPAATWTICVELAARFCADALAESYFTWDRRRYPSASAHNQARTRTQLAVAREVACQLGAMQRIVNAAFG